MRQLCTLRSPHEMPGFLPRSGRQDEDSYLCYLELGLAVIAASAGTFDASPILGVRWIDYLLNTAIYETTGITDFTNLFETLWKETHYKDVTPALEHDAEQITLFAQE